MRTDAELTADLHAALHASPALAHADIVIEVKDGVVALGGHVCSDTGKLEALAVAQKIQGVRAIANDIEVKRGTAPLSDRELAEAASRVLRASTSVPAHTVTAIVKDAWVTLEGSVCAWYQKDAAETAVSGLWGVKGLTNNITVTTSTDAGHGS